VVIIMVVILILMATLMVMRDMVTHI